ncbi:UNVERIFIED_CONTAM: hypothetical protein FKN15_021377 [Acipenser sinensis]
MVKQRVWIAIQKLLLYTNLPCNRVALMNLERLKLQDKRKLEVFFFFPKS